jgi:hypothetical protein
VELEIEGSIRVGSWDERKRLVERRERGTGVCMCVWRDEEDKCEGVAKRGGKGLVVGQMRKN